MSAAMAEALPTEPNTALVREASARLKGAPADEILKWGLEHFENERIALCTSFQDEGMVLLDMAVKLDPKVQVFTIDTGRLPGETLDLMEEVRERFQVPIQILYPDADEVSQLVSENGINLFYKSPELRLSCCEVRKVNPLKRRLSTLDAWIAGLRRSQSEGRSTAQEIEVDHAHGGIVKLNPLAGWSSSDVLDYVGRNRLPRNPLYAQGYASIGCAPCTRAIAPGEDARAGRWWWEQGAKECGIHYSLAVGEDGPTQVVAISNRDH